VTSEINIHLEAVSTKTVWQELHKTNIHGRAAIVERLITENSAKSEEDGGMITKLGHLINVNT